MMHWEVGKQSLSSDSVPRCDLGQELNLSVQIDILPIR